MCTIASGWRIISWAITLKMSFISAAAGENGKMCRDEIGTVGRATKTTVLNIHKVGPYYDVYIGRPSKWGNPFTHRKDNTIAKFLVATREEAVEAYRDWIKAQPELLAALPELKGKRLGCFCKPQSCHGDILAEMADAL